MTHLTPVLTTTRIAAIIPAWLAGSNSRFCHCTNLDMQLCSNTCVLKCVLMSKLPPAVIRNRRLPMHRTAPPCEYNLYPTYIPLSCVWKTSFKAIYTTFPNLPLFPSQSHSQIMELRRLPLSATSHQPKMYHLMTIPTTPLLNKEE